MFKTWESRGWLIAAFLESVSVGVILMSGCISSLQFIIGFVTVPLIFVFAYFGGRADAGAKSGEHDDYL